MTPAEPRENILVIDDDTQSALSLKRQTEEAGYYTLVCTTADQAMTAAANMDVALAFVGLEHVGEGGLRLARQLREIEPGIEIILLAGEHSPESVVEAMRAGASDYLRRPFGPGDTVLALSRFEERRSLRRRMLQHEQHHAHMLENMPLVVFALRKDLSLAYINQAVFHTFGEHASQARAKPDWFVSRLHSKDRSAVVNQLLLAMDCNHPFTTECRMLHASGRMLHVIIKSIACQREGAGDAGLEGAIMDVTEQVLLEQALIQDEKLKTLGAISAEVAHEIRNPLVSIGGFARRIGKRLPDAPEVDIILRETLRLEKLLTRISNYLNPVSIQRTDCDVNAVLGECTALLAPEMTERDVWTVLDCDPDLPGVYADPDFLSQVFINLMLNGLRELKTGEFLRISTHSGGRTVQVQFRHRVSNGAYDPERLFLPFDEGGQAIGLPLCYRLLKNMGGMLSFSVDEGEGLFTASLPLRTASGDVIVAERRLIPAPGDEEFRSAQEDYRREDCFDEFLERELRLAVRQTSPISVLMVDVDNFESYANLYGRHHAGDCLTRIFATLKDSLKRPGDFATDLGGQQYAVVLPGTNETGAVMVAESMRRKVRALRENTPPGGKACILTVSIGVASVVPAAETASGDLISMATEALYRAKTNGRDMVFAPGLHRDHGGASTTT